MSAKIGGKASGKKGLVTSPYKNAPVTKKVGGKR